MKYILKAHKGQKPLGYLGLGLISLEAITSKL